MLIPFSGGKYWEVIYYHSLVLFRGDQAVNGEFTDGLDGLAPV